MTLEPFYKRNTDPVKIQVALLHQSRPSKIYSAFMLLNSFKTLTLLTGWPSDTSSRRITSIRSMSSNSRLRLVASGIIRTNQSIPLISPKPIHFSLWKNQSGTLSQIGLELHTVPGRQHLCHQCMSVWRPTFLTVS